MKNAEHVSVLAPAILKNLHVVKRSMFSHIVIGQNQANAVDRVFAVQRKKECLIDFKEDPALLAGQHCDVNNKTLPRRVLDHGEEDVTSLSIKISCAIHELNFRIHLHCADHFV